MDLLRCWNGSTRICHGCKFTGREEHIAIAERAKEVLKEHPRPRRVRIATMQYLLRPISSFEEFATQVEFFVRSAKEYNCQFVLFPELFTMQLLSYLRESSPGRSTRILAQLTLDYDAIFKWLAANYNLYIYSRNTSCY